MCVNACVCSPTVHISFCPSSFTSVICPCSPISQVTVSSACLQSVDKTRAKFQKGCVKLELNVFFSFGLFGIWFIIWLKMKTVGWVTAIIMCVLCLYICMLVCKHAHMHRNSPLQMVSFLVFSVLSSFQFIVCLEELLPQFIDLTFRLLRRALLLCPLQLSLQPLQLCTTPLGLSQTLDLQVLCTVNK